MNSDYSLLEAILQRLNVLIALQLDAKPEIPATSMAQRILRLAEFGLGPAEIGSILGKKANYVSAVIGSRRKRPRG
jgi:hypothetical protein